MRELSGVYLGVKLTPDGWNDGYIDEVETPVPEAGIVFGVEQTSCGWTFIFAKPLPGFSVEALDSDKSSAQAMAWRKTRDGLGKVEVTSDYGNGSGIVKVTDAEGTTKYYALGADFAGEPDSWRVKGGLVEVWPTEPALPSAASELPSGE